MVANIVTQINWLDLVIVVIFLRIAYVSVKTGLPAELFKFFGSLFSVFISLHYYPNLTSAVLKFLGLKTKSHQAEFIGFLSMLVLAGAVYLIFSLLRMLFYRFIKMEAVAALSKWGGFILGLLRAVLVSGMLLFTLFCSGVPYLNKSVRIAYSDSYLLPVAPSIYAAGWNNLVSKFSSPEAANNFVLDFPKESGK